MRITSVFKNLATFLAVTILPFYFTGCHSMDHSGHAHASYDSGPVYINVSSVGITEEGPSEVAVGSPFDYAIEIANTDPDYILADVEVVQELDDGFTIQSSTPKAVIQGRTATWRLGDLSLDEVKRITIKGVSSRSGDIANCTKVNYNKKTCTVITAVQPALEVTKSAVEAILTCDVIPIRISVSNPGSGALHNVVVRDKLPSGMQTSSGKSSAEFVIDVLDSGQSETFEYDAEATHKGTFTHEVVVTSNEGLSDRAAVTTVVRQPLLTARCSGPSRVYLGRVIKYAVTVENRGDGIAENVVIESSIPGGIEFIKASDGGVYLDGRVSWDLDSLAPNKVVNLDVTVKGIEPRMVTTTVSASAACAEPVSSTCSSEIIGISAILLEVIDIEDPIEVYSNETYVITATNQGSADGTNLKIVCDLEKNQEYVSSTGPTTATVSGSNITFAPLSSLGPKEEAVWELVVKNVLPGDTRFSVALTSDQLKRPVSETESTNIYE